MCVVLECEAHNLCWNLYSRRIERRTRKLVRQEREKGKKERRRMKDNKADPERGLSVALLK
jgi:hypothetical protein